MNPWTRREFVGRSALAAAAPVAAGLIAARAASGQEAKAAGANDKIRVGLIGSGGRGQAVLEAFLKRADVDCPVLCDVDDKMLADAVRKVEKARGKAPETVKDFLRVLDRKDVDAVIVATPDHWHALPTVLACQAGKDVYVEKPLATTIAEGRAMRDAARKHERVAQMGTQWKSCSHFYDAVEFVRSGKLGKVRLVRGWCHLDWINDIGNPPDGDPPAGVDYDRWLGPAPQRRFNPNRFHFNFRWFWDYAGGLMTDWGVHLINVMLWAMGPEPPRTVSATGGKHILTDNTETPDTLVAVYDFPGYTLIWEHEVGCAVGFNGRPWGIWFGGTEGTLILDADGWEIIPEPKKKSLEAFKKPGTNAQAVPAHVQNFLECVRSRQQPVENLDAGHFVTTVAHLGNIAFRCGRKVAWDAQAERVDDPEANRLVGVEYRKPWTLPYMR